MIFLIAFNRNYFDWSKEQEIMQALGATEDRSSYWTINLDSFEDLGNLERNLNKITGNRYWDLIISVEEKGNHTIFFNDDLLNKKLKK